MYYRIRSLISASRNVFKNYEMGLLKGKQHFIYLMLNEKGETVITVCVSTIRTVSISSQIS